MKPDTGLELCAQVAQIIGLKSYRDCLPTTEHLVGGGQCFRYWQNSDTREIWLERHWRPDLNLGQCEPLLCWIDERTYSNHLAYIKQPEQEQHYRFTMNHWRTTGEAHDERQWLIATQVYGKSRPEAICKGVVALAEALRV